MGHRLILSAFVQVMDAIHTDIFSVIIYQIAGARTEDAGRLIFLQNDLILIQINLYLIPLCDIQRTTQLNGKYNSSQIIKFTNDTG